MLPVRLSLGRFFLSNNSGWFPDSEPGSLGTVLECCEEDCWTRGQQSWIVPKIGTVTGTIAGSPVLIEAVFSLVAWCETRIARQSWL